MTELQRLITGNAAFTPPERILAHLADADITRRAPGAPHSIAEELWHLVYWQRLFLRWVQREEMPYPQHSSEGWRRLDVMDAHAWHALVDEFARDLTAASAVAADARMLASVSTCEEIPGAPLTVQEVLENLAVHNAYHLGRIVFLRQLLGSWPPPGGGDSW